MVAQPARVARRSSSSRLDGRFSPRRARQLDPHVGDLAVADGGDLRRRQRVRGPLEHLGDGRRVRAPRQLGREVRERRLVGLDRAEAGEVDARVAQIRNGRWENITGYID